MGCGLILRRYTVHPRAAAFAQAWVELEVGLAAGGWVHNNRIHGVLSVSRAFGDVEHKRLKTKSWEKEFVSDPLIATPEIQSERLGEDDEFMIIACDGLWDVMTSQQAVNFVRRRLYVRVGCLCGMASA